MISFVADHNEIVEVIRKCSTLLFLSSYRRHAGGHARGAQYGRYRPLNLG
ncbi:hypothetical protein [Nitrosomonas sp. Nm34]|nr:hypothetical protein [Nitrosomonas sp. Nm34]